MIYPFMCDSCGHSFDIELSLSEYETFKPAPCDKCGDKTRRVYTVPSVSWFCGRTLEPNDFNYKKKTGEIEDGHKKTLRKQKEGVDLGTFLG